MNLGVTKIVLLMTYLFEMNYQNFASTATPHLDQGVHQKYQNLISKCRIKLRHTMRTCRRGYSSTI